MFVCLVCLLVCVYVIVHHCALLCLVWFGLYVIVCMFDLFVYLLCSCALLLFACCYVFCLVCLNCCLFEGVALRTGACSVSGARLAIAEHPGDAFSLVVRTFAIRPQAPSYESKHT